MTGGRWSDLRLRVASAAVLVPVAIACLWYGGFPFVLLVAVAAAGMGTEWGTISGGAPTRWPGLLLPAELAAAAVIAGSGQPGGAALVLLATAALLIALSKGRRFWSAAGVLYLGPTAIALPWLRADLSAGFDNVLFLLLLVWASDIGAYLVGRCIGGPKLAPRISPGKTWSGAVGGLVAAVGVAWLAAALLRPPAAPWPTVPLAAALGIAAQAGDLFESWVKRHFGVKDSGRSIPGHGGLLDRLDAALAVLPLAAALALAAGRGVVIWQ